MDFMFYPCPFAFEVPNIGIEEQFISKYFCIFINTFLHVSYNQDNPVCYFASSFSMLFSIPCGSVVGSKRQTTVPLRLMRNLVKFHLMSGFEA